MTHEQVSALLARYSTAVMKAYRSPENDHPDLEPARQAIIDVLLRQPPEASALSGWQPIETAPSGTSVLCYWPAVQRNDVKHEAYTGQAWQRFGNWFRTRDGYGAPANEVNDPTHWRPLIASPGTDPTPPRGGEPSDVDHLMRALVQQECVLNECEALLKQMLDDDGVDVGFDERLAAYWVSSKALSDWRSRDCQLKQPHEPGAGLKCHHCNGAGKLQTYDHMTGYDETACDTCNGVGRIFTIEQYLKTLPANWHEDSSLETWFPLAAEELERIKSERASAPPTYRYVSIGYQYRFPSVWGGHVWRDSPERYNGADHDQTREVFMRESVTKDGSQS